MLRWWLLLFVVGATIQQRKPCIDNCLNDDILTENIIVSCLQLKCREILQNISKYEPAINIYVQEHKVYTDLSDHMQAYMHKKHMMQRINEYGELKLKTMTQDVIDSYLVYTNILTQVYKLLDSLGTIESVEEEQKAFEDMESILNNSTEYMPSIQNAVQILNAELVRIAASVNQTFFLFQTMMNRRISIMLLRKHMYNASNEIRNHIVHYKPLILEPYADLDALSQLDWSVDVSDDLLDPSNVAETRLCPMCPTCPTCPMCPTCPTCPICPTFLCPACPVCPVCPVCPICQQTTDCIHTGFNTTHSVLSTSMDHWLFGGIGLLIGLVVGGVAGYFLHFVSCDTSPQPHDGRAIRKHHHCEHHHSDHHRHKHKTICVCFKKT